jgi:hypothetical protein
LSESQLTALFDCPPIPNILLWEISLFGKLRTADNWAINISGSEWFLELSMEVLNSSYKSVENLTFHCGWTRFWPHQENDRLGETVKSISPNHCREKIPLSFLRSRNRRMSDDIMEMTLLQAAGLRTVLCIKFIYNTRKNALSGSKICASSNVSATARGCLIWCQGNLARHSEKVLNRGTTA